MFDLSNKNIFLIIICISIASISSFSIRQSKTDDICGPLSATLNVEKTLDGIKVTTKDISLIINGIADRIQNKYSQHESVTFQNAVNYVLEKVHFLPTTQYHSDLFQSSNIDQKYFISVITEAYEALSFYYHSVNDILSNKDGFLYTYRDSFDNLQDYLKSKMICEYRRILNVYSSRRRPINSNKSIQFSPERDHGTPSVRQDIHTIIILRLLREWMNRIESVISVLDKKLI